MQTEEYLLAVEDKAFVEKQNLETGIMFCELCASHMLSTCLVVQADWEGKWGVFVQAFLFLSFLSTSACVYRV